MKIHLILNNIYFIQYKTRANYFLTRLMHGIKFEQKLTTENLTQKHTHTHKLRNLPLAADSMK